MPSTPKVTVAACQVRIDIDDPAGTWQALVAAVNEAADRGAGVIVVPELATSGYVFHDVEEARSRAETATGPTVELLRRLSAEHRAVIVGGFCETATDASTSSITVYNSAAILDCGALLAVYRKTHLWDTEKLIFTPGDEVPPVVVTSMGQVAAMICYDLELPEMVRNVALRGAQLVVAPSNWPNLGHPSEERPAEIAKAQASASVNRVAVVVADRCGPERGVDWIGGSVICDVRGSLSAGPELGVPTVLTAELDLEAALDKRVSARNDAFGDRRPELY